ncbi:hypothetical protein FRB99_005095 [Tulasnella sp. 403]|nr:hypothetical protein FRB99_005095 [Tulasnella sp. 403]
MNGTSSDSPAPPQSLLSFLFSFSSSFGDWLKLAVLGAIVEFARRTCSMIWAAFLASFFITAHFEDADDAHDWIMIWLASHPAWKTPRELQVSTRNFAQSGRYVVDEDNDVLIADDVPDGQVRRGRKLNFIPSFGSTNTIFYKRHPIRITRDRQFTGDGNTVETLTLRIFGRDHGILRSLLQEAQGLYKAQEQNRIGIHIADNYSNWRWSGSRPKRPLDSIVLEPGVKEMVIEDAEDFLDSEEWYAARGIPFRRGYLLYGAPGSGKTSLIHAVAGALNLDIYVISLSKRGMDDSTLNELICDLPARSIALMEDIDAAFTHGVNRDNSGDDDKSESDSGSSPSGVTLSGLLNAIDGVAAQEGEPIQVLSSRILFATTNRYRVLDSALIRPGRLDVHVEFHLASSWQAGEIFKRFYPATESTKDSNTTQDPHDSSNEKSTISGPSPPEPSSAPSPPPTPAKRIAPKLTVKERDDLASEFAAAIPDRVVSMAAIQGHLMNFKTRPLEAVANAKSFVEEERRKALERAEIAKPTTPILQQQ